MNTEYWIERTEENTQIERQTEPSVAQHYVLWPRQMIEVRFADGVDVCHLKNYSLVRDPTTERKTLRRYKVKPGESRRIIIEEEE